MDQQSALTTNGPVNGTCPHDCPDACGVVTTVKNGRAVGFQAQQQHPVAQGWLCAKVNPYLDRVYHPDRLTTPLIQRGKKGSDNWQPISWQNAIDIITGRWKQLCNTHGAESILPYSYSGTLGLVQMVVASARLWNRMGASQLQRSLCMAATRSAIRATLGHRMSPPYHHVLDSRLLILWAHNPVSTAPHLMPWIRQSHREGCKVVVIDPIRTRTARSADTHIQPKPGTDTVLALGIARQLIVCGHHDRQWIAQHTAGWGAYQQHVMQYDLDRVAAITGVATELIEKLANWYGTMSPAMIRLGDGINRHLEGGQTVRAIACLPAITGQYGRRGGGISCSTGDYFQWDVEAINHWSDCPPPGRMININRLGAALNGEAADPSIQALYVFCANPMISTPNTALVKQGLEREDLFTVVHDLFMTDTAKLADLVLPATSQLEQTDLHRGYGHTLLGYNHPAITPLGESKSNWQVMQLLSKAMGYEDDWLHQSVDEVIDEILHASRNNTARLDHITLDTLKRQPYVAFASADEVPFSDSVFDTPSGKVELASSVFQELGQSALPTWNGNSDNQPGSGYCIDCGSQLSFQLLSPAAHHFVNSSLANVESLVRKEKQPVVLLHPEDIKQLKLNEGDLARLYNHRGYCLRNVRLSTDVLPGVAVAITGFWATQAEHSTVNWTTSDHLADVAGQSTFHSNRVWIVAE